MHRLSMDSSGQSLPGCTVDTQGSPPDRGSVVGKGDVEKEEGSQGKLEVEGGAEVEEANSQASRPHGKLCASKPAMPETLLREYTDLFWKGYLGCPLKGKVTTLQDATNATCQLFELKSPSSSRPALIDLTAGQSPSQQYIRYIH